MTLGRSHQHKGGSASKTLLNYCCALESAHLVTTLFQVGNSGSAKGRPRSPGRKLNLQRKSTTRNPDATLRPAHARHHVSRSNTHLCGQEDVSKISPSASPSKSRPAHRYVLAGWEAVENASLALRRIFGTFCSSQGAFCADGKNLFQSENPDWPKLVARLHDAAMGAYKVAQAKNTDDMLDGGGCGRPILSRMPQVYGSNRSGQEHCVAVLL